MKKRFLLLAGITAYAAPLIHLSSQGTPENLAMLSAKYQQPLLVGGSNVYLIPGECQVERYFGGASEGVLNLVQGPVRTEALLTTQAVFDAKEEKEIVKKIELENTVAIAQGNIAKAFLEDNEGRSFGGASEVPLILDNEIVPSVIHKDTAGAAKPMQVPSCKLLNDGSGYTIDAVSNAQFYFNGTLTPITNDTVLF